MAEDWGDVETRNPAERVSIGRKKAKRRKRMLSDQQIRELLRLLIRSSHSFRLR